VAGVRLGHGVERMALGAGLSVPLVATAGAETARAGLLEALTARGRAALAAGLPPWVLSGVHPCLEVEEKGGQRPHQGQDSFCTLHVGGTDIFRGREALGCQGLSYALLSSALHEGMLNFRVCLSSYQYSFIH
jgi:hypothetical protein